MTNFRTGKRDGYARIPPLSIVTLSCCCNNNNNKKKKNKIYFNIINVKKASSSSIYMKLTINYYNMKLQYHIFVQKKEKKRKANAVAFHMCQI